MEEKPLEEEDVKERDTGAAVVCEGRGIFTDSVSGAPLTSSERCEKLIEFVLIMFAC